MICEKHHRALTAVKTDDGHYITVCVMCNKEKEENRNNQ